MTMVLRNAMFGIDRKLKPALVIELGMSGSEVKHV